MKAIVVIPTLNEASHIREVVLQLSEPLADGVPPEIWVMDGRSTDDTRDVVNDMALTHVKVVDNPHRTQAHAINIAAALAANIESVDVLIRADAHASYPTGFVAGLLQVLDETSADSAVVPLRTVGGDRVRDAAALLFGSRLGNGGSPHRTGEHRGFVEHGHHAAFRLKAFLAVKGYDTFFAANEDAEFDHRLSEIGGKIFLEPALSVDYKPRGSVLGTFKQYARNGTGRVRRALKHHLRLGMRQILPAVLLPLLFVATVLGIFVSSLFLIVPLGYLLALAAASMVVCVKADRILLFPLVVALALATHTGFSFGASREWIRCALSSERRRWLRSDKDRLLSSAAT